MSESNYNRDACIKYFKAYKDCKSKQVSESVCVCATMCVCVCVCVCVCACVCISGSLQDCTHVLARLCMHVSLHMFAGVEYVHGIILHIITAKVNNVCILSHVYIPFSTEPREKRRW